MFVWDLHWKQSESGVFGLTVCWGISKVWGVWITEVSLLVHNKLRSSEVLGLISSLVKISLKLWDKAESVGEFGFEC